MGMADNLYCVHLSLVTISVVIAMRPACVRPLSSIEIRTGISVTFKTFWFFLSHYTVVWGYFVYCVYFLFVFIFLVVVCLYVRLRISQRRKKIAA